jgi:hypothetical protein
MTGVTSQFAGARSNPRYSGLATRCRSTFETGKRLDAELFHASRLETERQRLHRNDLAL